jgi:hypothetical protein
MANKVFCVGDNDELVPFMKASEKLLAEADRIVVNRKGEVINRIQAKDLQKIESQLNKRRHEILEDLMY